MKDVNSPSMGTKPMGRALDDAILCQLFVEARSQNGWLDAPVSDDQIRRIYELAKMGPTSMNCQPGRYIFVRSRAGKERLRPAISPGNVDKVMSAPAVAIIGYDEAFHVYAAEFFPHRPQAAATFADNPHHGATTAFRNCTLQGAYLMMAARAIGLDCGPMSGFDQALVEKEFFAAMPSIRANFLCCLGHGDPSKIFARLPRFSFEERCTLL